jgi:predicted DNA-binding protein YlxM (UPF0122 family)
MICMETIAKIRRLYHKESLSIRAIALKLNINRRTVKKHIEQTQIPVYQKPAKRYPMLGDFLTQLDQRLIEAQSQMATGELLLCLKVKMPFWSITKIIIDRIYDE